MKLISCIITFALLCAVINTSAQKKQILFIGNSYTYTNDLPTTLYRLALSGEDTIQFDSSAPGGYTFEMHTTNPTTLSKINSTNWDYVILQDQSQLPSFPPTQVEIEVYPFAHALDSLIHKNDSCTKTLFFMTWGRKYGDAINCQYYPPVCTFEGMNQRLRESYLEMGVRNDAEVAPVGVAWRRSRMADSTLDLWSGDYSHPSIAGTYLTACVFYSSIYKKPSAGLSYISSLTAAQALFLQQIADSTVLDSLPNWHIGEFDPSAAFTWQVADYDLSFENQSVNATAFQWNFGDGSTSTEQNPVHSYSGPGTYAVQLVVTDSCQWDTLEQTIEIFTTGLEQSKYQTLSSYPNPFNNNLNILVPGNTSNKINVCITTPDGRKLIEQNLLQSKDNNEFQINTTDLPQGMYFIIISTPTSTYSFKSVKTNL